MMVRKTRTKRKIFQISLEKLPVLRKKLLRKKEARRGMTLMPLI
jgi:hypothetical protein